MSEEVKSQATSVGADWPNQVARLTTLRGRGVEIGPAGAFYVATIDATLKAAQEAWESGDVIQIVKAYQAMREIEE